MLNVIVVCVLYAECRVLYCYSERHYAEHYYAEYCYAERHYDESCNAECCYAECYLL